jgi:signal transduction histidine kinase
VSQEAGLFDLEAALITGRIRRLRVIIPIAAALVLAGLATQGPISYKQIGPALFGFQLATNVIYLLVLAVAWVDTGARRVVRATTLTVAGGLMFNVALSVTGPAHGTLVFGPPLMGMIAIGGVVLSPHTRAWLWGVVAGAMHIAMMITKGLLDPAMVANGLRQHIAESTFVGTSILLTTWFATRLIQDLNLALQETERARVRQQQLNEELEQARAAAMSASQAKTSFIASMSHELRTPLQAIIGYVELVQEEILDEEVNITVLSEDLTHVSDAAHHLSDLITNILDLSKIESGKMEILWDDISINDLLDRVRSTATPLAFKRGNTLLIEDETGAARWRTDRMKLQQSLLNLLSNAAKFTEGGTIRLRVSLRGDQSGSRELVAEVEDTGVGMSAAQLERLFKAFSQADGARTTSQYGGTGLGLMLTRSFCEQLGGAVTVRSAVGVGTTFTITLPEQIA